MPDLTRRKFFFLGAAAGIATAFWPSDWVDVEGVLRPKREDFYFEYVGLTLARTTTKVPARWLDDGLYLGLNDMLVNHPPQGRA